MLAVAGTKFNRGQSGLAQAVTVGLNMIRGPVGESYSLETTTGQLRDQRPA